MPDLSVELSWEANRIEVGMELALMNDRIPNIRYWNYANLWTLLGPLYLSCIDINVQSMDDHNTHNS